MISTLIAGLGLAGAFVFGSMAVSGGKNFKENRIKYFESLTAEELKKERNKQILKVFCCIACSVVVCTMSGVVRNVFQNISSDISSELGDYEIAHPIDLTRIFYVVKYVIIGLCILCLPICIYSIKLASDVLRTKEDE